MARHEVEPVAGVLVASDDAATRDRLRRDLRGAGHGVREANDGEECLREVLSLPPDLIICDLSRGTLDNLRVCQLLKSGEVTRHIPVILLMPPSQRRRRVDAIEAGADDVLAKPIIMPEVLARVRTLLRFKRLDDEARRQRRVIDSLLMISTMCQGYADASTRMFADFGRRAGELLRAAQVAVLLGRHGSAPTLHSCWPARDTQLVMDRVAQCAAVNQVLSTALPVTVWADDTGAQRALGLTGGFVGVPMLGYDGRVLGAVVAFGTPTELRPESVRILLALAGRIGSEIQMRDHSDRLEELVAERTRDLVDAKGALENAQEDMVFRLALAAELRDNETANHLRRMGRYAVLMGHALGFGAEFVGLLKQATVMHDIGKIGIPDNILLKPDRLTDEEFEIMKRHTVLGAQIFQGSEAPLLQMSERVALCHHECWNGSGYPNGREGEEIPIEARIVAVADVFDALISARPYKPPWPIPAALEHVASVAGSHLDPEVLNCFLALRGSMSEVALSFSDKRRGLN